MCQTNRMNVGRSLFFLSPCIVTVILMQCAPLFFPKPLSNYTNTQQGLSAPPSTSLPPPPVIMVLWSAGTTSQSCAHEQTPCVCVCFYFYFFSYYSKECFCCCDMERKHRMTPPCEHTPTFQPEQSRIKKKKSVLHGRVPTPASSSPSYFQPL